MSHLLSIENLVISYGPIAAVKGVSLHVDKGQIVAILGANGAGKTTLMKSIAGIKKPTSGSLMFDGKVMNQLPPYAFADKGILASPEGRMILKDLTVEENLRVGAYSLKNQPGLSSKEQMKANFARVFKYFPILQERKHQLGSTLSGGEQQMLAIGRALMGSPRLLLLDEPSLGLAPLIVKQIFMILKQIASEGTTILIVEQNALQTLKIADYAYVLTLGKVSDEGTSDVLLSHDGLISAYLGGLDKKEEKI
jgi:branched-chain amino acid transport system ATP-binding protein